jgi:AbrB family looped-hinge helix DNA binding protein
MSILSTRVNSKHQITIPQIVRKKLSIKPGDHLLVDVQDGLIILIPQPENQTKYLHGLHSDIWKEVDIQKYTNGERDAWVVGAD